VPSAPPSAEAEPLFASDEEALEAAEAAYREYLTVSDEVFGAGGVGVERLQPLTTGQVWQEDQERAARYESEGLQQDGTTEILEFTLQQVDSGPPTAVIAYACLDARSIRVVDAEGNDVSSAEVPPTVTFEITLETDTSPDLKVSRSEVWTSGASCD